MIIPKTLPENLIVGYANWGQCDEKIIEIVKDGVNVLMWFSINLEVNSDGNPHISVLPDLKCVTKIANQLKELNLPTIHMISIGGWNAPHPDTSIPTQEMYDEFVRWNEVEVKSHGFDGFDGFDWDIEGHDDITHKQNTMTVECIHFMGLFSQLGKKDGFLVSMAPMESYLDVTTSAFDCILNHEYEEWINIQPDFKYHGHNTYAPLLSNKYGKTIVDGKLVDTFDFIFLQFYESYSHALYNITKEESKRQSPTQYFLTFVQKITSGWMVQFENEPNIQISNQVISVPKSKLILGFANGWAYNHHKSLFLQPEQIKQVYTALDDAGIRPRGCGFWNIKDEGQNKVYLAKGFNSFLNTRSTSPKSKEL